MKLASLKLQVRHRRIRVLPLELDGSPFEGPGVDLLEAALDGLIEPLAQKLGHWFEIRESGATLRSITFRFDDHTILATCEASEGRPLVTRLDAHSSHELFEELAPFLDEIGRKTLAALRLRRVASDE